MSYEIIKYNNKTYAEIIRKEAKVSQTTFFSDLNCSFQFGIMAHKAGFFEKPHTHFSVIREIKNMQQMFFVKKGIIAVIFFDDEGNEFEKVILRSGDSICLVDGAHAIKVIEDSECITVKQGPFLGSEIDKIILK
jgi:hypothetical protein